MTQPRPDALLRVTRLLLNLCRALAAIVAVLLLVLIPAIWIFPEHIIVEGVDMVPHGLAALSVVLFLLAGAGALAFLFLARLIAIIDTVGKGTPFTAENGDRMRAMGWIALGSQALVLAARPTGDWLRTFSSDFVVHIEISLGAILMAALLFIFARVFDHGARLELDVEGTI